MNEGVTEIRRERERYSEEKTKLSGVNLSSFNLALDWIQMTVAMSSSLVSNFTNKISACVLSCFSHV